VWGKKSSRQKGGEGVGKKSPVKKRLHETEKVVDFSIWTQERGI